MLHAAGAYPYFGNAISREMPDPMLLVYRADGGADRTGHFTPVVVFSEPEDRNGRAEVVPHYGNERERNSVCVKSCPDGIGFIRWHGLILLRV